MKNLSRQSFSFCCVENVVSHEWIKLITFLRCKALHRSSAQSDFSLFRSAVLRIALN